MRALAAFVLVGLPAFVAGCDSLGTDPPPDAASQTPWTEMLDAVNAVRARPQTCGGERMPAVGPVAWNDRLEAAALRHTLDMEAHSHFDHTGTDGSRPGDRATDAGYRWRLVGENIARYQTDVDQVVGDWVASASHCRQLMDPRVVEMGAAERAWYWTQVFGTPG